MADNARISIAGLNEFNVAYVAKSISDCLKGTGTTEGRPRVMAVL